ncbi:MAG: DUF4097 domain-containing protein [Clostridiales bacterium]|nr:DUF4097 domain-containing protein [Clostridiales bacterium]
MKMFTKICLGIALISIGLGIGLLLIAGVNGLSLRGTPLATFEDTVRDVRGLDLRMDFGEIYITQGETFSIEARNLYREADLISEVSDGIWVISHETSDNLNILGFNIPVSLGLRSFKTPSIRITIPEDFKAEDVRISLDAGSLKAENLSADRGMFTVNAGSLEIDGLTVEEESRYYVDAGKIRLEQADINNITVECNVGLVYIDGIILGDNSMFCDVGSISLKLNDDMEYYSFDIDSDLGNVIINNRKYRNYKSAKENNNGSFRLNVDVGSVTMDFIE